MIIMGTRVEHVLHMIACRRATRLINAPWTAHLAYLVEDSSKNLCQLWKTVDGLLYPPQAATTSPVDWAQTIAEYFANKVSNIRLRAATMSFQLISAPITGTSIPVG